MRTAWELALWLLSPSRGALALKCIFAGVVLKVLSFLVVVPLAWLVADPAGGAAEPVTGRMVAEAALMAPVLETLLMAAVFGVLGRLLDFDPVVPGIVVVLGAVALHDHDLVTAAFVALMFAAFSVQYVRFRAFVPVNTAMLAVALTHGTVNLLGLAVALAT